MKNNWKETTLGEISEKMYSGGTPSTKRDDFYGGNIPWLRTQEVNFNYIYDTEIKISEEGLKNSSAKWTPKNTVVIAMYGNSAGRTAFSKIKTTTNQACCNFVADLQKVDPLFVYFNLMGRYSEIEGMANGAAQQNLSVGGLKALKIILPPLPEQKVIAGVLGALDDKIELLREQNKTLEATAQTIFKEWFVNFNFPDENGKPYKDTGGKMIDSELGEIPDGWRVENLEKIVNHVKKNSKPSENPSTVYNHFSIPAYDQNKTPDKSLGENILSSKYLIDQNCFLVSKLNPKTPRVWSIINPEDNCICSTEFQVIAPKLEKNYSYIYSILNSPEFTKEFASRAKGTSSSHQRSNPQDILTYEILIPEKSVLEKFQKTIDIIIYKVENNNSQIQTLSKIRDTLLPKLMSGEITL